MTLQSILSDPNISVFLQQIPHDQHVITLKELIYIGIKIVTNSFNQSSSNQHKQFQRSILSDVKNKQNRNCNRNVSHKSSKTHGFGKRVPEEKQSHKEKKRDFNSATNRTAKIQSSVLREISKIRQHLQHLTNKVYDHYFEQKDQQIQIDESVSDNAAEQADYVQPYGFNYNECAPTFSPSKINRKTNQSSNPFLKQKNNFSVTNSQTNHGEEVYRKRSLQNKCPVHPDFQQRNRARSDVLHWDDTQVRQAIYREENDVQNQHSNQKNRFKKSQSLIQKNHQEKKKQQQNYFYNLALDKQNIKQQKKYKQIQPLQASIYRDIAVNKPIKVDPYKMKAKSKIKKLVQRDRLRHKLRSEEENFQKGLQQYEYSANELNDEEEIQDQNQSYSDQQKIEESEQKHESHERKQSSHQGKYERKRQIVSKNSNFYQSQQRSSRDQMNENTFSNNNRNIEEGDQVIDGDKESSFSQFSQFSMSSSNSKRQAGKFSRRKIK